MYGMYAGIDGTTRPMAASITVACAARAGKKTMKVQEAPEEVILAMQPMVVARYDATRPFSKQCKSPMLSMLPNGTITNGVESATQALSVGSVAGIGHLPAA